MPLCGVCDDRGCSFCKEPKKSGSRQDLRERFEAFHEANPQVYTELVKLARKAKSRGRSRIGIRMLWEVTRWNLTIETETSDFKLNDHYHSRYARLIMEREKDLAGVFELRELK